jgi:type IV secretory pathway TrbF-like protein
MDFTPHMNVSSVVITSPDKISVRWRQNDTQGSKENTDESHEIDRIICRTNEDTDNLTKGGLRYINKIYLIIFLDSANDVHPTKSCVVWKVI